MFPLGLAAAGIAGVVDWLSGKQSQDNAAKQYATRYQTTVADMKKAGLNPALAYGGISGNPNTPAMPELGSSAIRAKQAAENSELTRAQANLLKAQTADLIQQTRLRNAEILTHTNEMGARGQLLMLEQEKIGKVMESLELDNQFKRGTVDTRIDMVKKELEKLGVNIDYITAQKILAEYASGLGKAEYDYYTGLGRYSPLLNDASQLFRNFVPRVNIFGDRTYNTLRPYR